MYNRLQSRLLHSRAKNVKEGTKRTGDVRPSAREKEQTEYAQIIKQNFGDICIVAKPTM